MPVIRLTLFALTFISTLSSANNAFIEKEVNAYMKANNVPALSVGIIENGKVTFKQAYGVYKRESSAPITPDSLFQIGSQTKVITSIVTLALIEDGKLSLTDNLSELLPEHFLAIDKNKLQHITIDTLLSHRSGLPNYPSNVSRIDGDPMEGGYSEQQLLQALKNTPLKHEPNSKFAYANFNYALLGYILSKKTNKTFPQLVDIYIHKRFAITDMYVQLSSTQKNRLVTPYRKDNKNAPTKAWDMGLLTPHGGMYSSVEGMLQLMQQQLAAYNVNKNNANASSPLLSTQVSYATGLYDGLDYGYGMFSATPELGLYPETVLWHGGDLDGFGSEYIFAPESNNAVVLLTSSGGREFVMLGRKLMNHLLSRKE